MSDPVKKVFEAGDAVFRVHGEAQGGVPDQYGFNLDAQVRLVVWTSTGGGGIAVQMNLHDLGKLASELTRMHVELVTADRPINGSVLRDHVGEYGVLYDVGRDGKLTPR